MEEKHVHTRAHTRTTLFPVSRWIVVTVRRASGRASRRAPPCGARARIDGRVTAVMGRRGGLLDLRTTPNTHSHARAHTPHSLHIAHIQLLMILRAPLMIPLENKHKLKHFAQSQVREASGGAAGNHENFLKEE